MNKNVFKTPMEIQHPMIYWIKKNLFSTPLNSLLTIFTFYLLYKLVIDGIVPLAHLDWHVIPANLKLILVGSYPAAQLPQVWVIVCYFFFFISATFSCRYEKLPVPLILIMIFFLGMSLIPFSVTNRIFCLVCFALCLAGFYGTKLVPASLRLKILAVAWLLFIPLAFILVSGFGSHHVKSNYWGGLLLSMLVSLTTIVVSFPVGLLLALGRRSKLPLIKGVSTFLIEVVRGVPLITILFIGYLIIPLALPPSLSPSVLARAIIGIILFHSAYMAENFRGGLQGIPKTQYEAAEALGFNSFHTMVLIILPQVLKRMIPVLVSEFTGILKDTSLVSIIGLLDLIGISTSISSNPKYMTCSTQVLSFLALIYFVLCYSISGASYKLEKKLNTNVHGGVGR
ncbi:MAG: amino acid ABC transporter permease [Spirochaetia bacterium]|jgi:general L-amino acid transport system permease protein|nr:amino acid ABC transporter permease [Spirochaetia bacterium]